MRQYLLTRSAYGPAWTIEANSRRLQMSRGVTIRSICAQTNRDFTWLVLLHPDDPLRVEREAAFSLAGAQCIYMDRPERTDPAGVAWLAYGADWAGAIGARDEKVAMTRLDDDDAFAPWAMDRIRLGAEHSRGRAILMLPTGIRVFRGRFTLVYHQSNAMQTLVTPVGDTATVYDYGHRDARNFAPITPIDHRIAWLWARHDDTISGWKTADKPLTPEYTGLFPVDWSLFGKPAETFRRSVSLGGRIFR